MILYINDITYALGQRSVSLNSDTGVRYFSTREALIDSGFHSHYVCSENQSAYDLAHSAVRQLSDKVGAASLQAVDAILYATCLTRNGNLGDWGAYEKSQDVKHLMDFPVSHLQADFSMDNAFLMGLNQTACTSLLGALRVAKSLLSSEETLQNILCLTADRFPNGAIYEQGYNVISDGAAACMVSKKPQGFRILGCHQISNGAMAKASDEETAGFYFNYTHKLLLESVSRCSLEWEQVDWIVPQNVNIKAWMVLCSILRFDMQRVLMMSRESIAHCISGDNLINLQQADDKKTFASGDIIVMPMAGFGLNWSCVVLEKV